MKAEDYFTYDYFFENELTYEDIIKKIKQFASDKCKEQRGLCNHYASVVTNNENILGSVIINEDSILNAEEPIL